MKWKKRRMTVFEAPSFRFFNEFNAVKFVKDYSLFLLIESRSLVYVCFKPLHAVVLIYWCSFSTLILMFF